jgi:hypothetical protein
MVCGLPAALDIVLRFNIPFLFAQESNSVNSNRRKRSKEIEQCNAKQAQCGKAT